MAFKAGQEAVRLFILSVPDSYLEKDRLIPLG